MFDVVLRTVTWDICSKGYFMVYTALFHRFPQHSKESGIHSLFLSTLFSFSILYFYWVQS